MTADDNYINPTRARKHNIDESCFRVRIFPSSSSCSPPPHPPSSLPPKPSHLCKIAVVGDALAGKSSIVQKFIHRHYVNHQFSNINNIGESAMNGGDLETSPTNNNNKNDKNNNNIDNSNGGAVASYNSMGSSFQSEGRYYHPSGKRGEQQSTLAEYYKKDITIICSTSHEDEASRAPVEGGDSQQPNMIPICIRVQCWDMNIPPQLIHPSTTTQSCTQINELDSYSYNAQQSVDSDLPTLLCNDNITESLLQLIKRVDGILLVFRCPLPPTMTHTSSSSLSSSNPYYFVSSSNASHVSYATDISSSGMGGGGGGGERGGVAVGWPELDTLQCQIQLYTSFLRNTAVNDSCNNEQLPPQQNDQTNQKQQHEKRERRTPPIFVLLSCSDLAAGEYSPRQYVKLSNMMDEICNQCGVISWRMGTCIDIMRNKDGCGGTTITTTTTTNASQRQEQQRQSPSLNLLQRMMKQQLHLLEDMEDAIEGIFMDMITHVLVSRREGECAKQSF